MFLRSLFFVGVLVGSCAWSGDVVSIQVKGNERMQFTPREIKVKVGSTVELVFMNVSRISNFPLNLVVLQPGVDVGRFGNAAMNAPNTEYIPVSMTADVLAHTPVINAGQQASIQFTLGARGTYHFICSYPGRYSVMQGQILVE